jgi:hypothetical protein
MLSALIDARLEAHRLAQDGADELAAFFYAFAMKSPALGEDFVVSAILVTVNQGRTLGRAPVTDARAFSREMLLQARDIAGGVTTFAQFRVWFARRSSAGPPR